MSAFSLFSASYAQDVASIPNTFDQKSAFEISSQKQFVNESNDVVAAATVAPTTATQAPITGNASVSQAAPSLVAPVVKEEKKGLLVPGNRKVDLKAIIFDPATMVKEPKNAEEMSAADELKYKFYQSLTMDVKPPSTKGLLEDTMKMTFTKGPFEYLAPWFDYGMSIQNLYTNDCFMNTVYSLTGMDVGINGKFRTKDDPKSGKKTVFRVMFNLNKEFAGTETYLQNFVADNYIMRYFTKDDQLLVGYARTAMGIEGGQSPLTLPFLFRSQVSRNYGAVRALGAKFQGDHKMYDYSAGIFSSSRYLKDFFPGEEIVLNASVKPLGMLNGKYGNLKVGGSLDLGSADGKSNGNGSFFVAGTHAAYEYKRLKLQAEYATARGSNGYMGYNPNTSEGYYATAFYRITPRLELLARWDSFDANKDRPNDRRTEYVAGVNYYVKGQALKLICNLVRYVNETGTYGSQIMTGFQILL